MDRIIQSSWKYYAKHPYGEPINRQLSIRDLISTCISHLTAISRQPIHVVSQLTLPTWLMVYIIFHWARVTPALSVFLPTSPFLWATEREALLEKYSSGRGDSNFSRGRVQFSRLFSVKTRPDVFTVFAKGYENIQRWRFVSVTVGIECGTGGKERQREKKRF